MTNSLSKKINNIDNTLEKTNLEIIKYNDQINKDIEEMVDLISKEGLCPLCGEKLNSKSIDNNSSTINHNLVKVPSHIYTRRSPDSQKNLRAKTVRIGKIRWPPPLNPEDTDNGNQHR